MAKESSPHTGHRQRMRARVEQYGLESLAPHEALEYVLYITNTRKDTNGLAHALMDRYQNCATPGYRPLPPYRSIGENKYYTHLSGFCQHFSASFSDFFKKSMIFVV